MGFGLCLGIVVHLGFGLRLGIVLLDGDLRLGIVVLQMQRGKVQKGQERKE